MLTGTTHVDLHHVLGSLRSIGTPPSSPGMHPAAWPFVTISREAGAGGHALGTLLAQRLNGIEFVGPRLRSGPHELEELAHPWQCLDRELVERIARDQHLSEELIDSLETSSHTWISDFFAGLSHSDNQPSELVIFRRVVETVRALAQAGHVILIGLGSVFMTRDMPAGIHIRLVAPLDHRIKAMARLHSVSESRARIMVYDLDARREAFFHRYWPRQTLSADLFHLTLNSGLLNEEQMVDTLLPLIKSILHVPA